MREEKMKERKTININELRTRKKNINFCEEIIMEGKRKNNI